MRKIFALFTVAFALNIGIASAQSRENTTVQIGKSAPELAFESPNGKVISLNQDLKDHYVLIDFWASWCGPCRRANPGLVEFYHTYKDKKFKDAKKGFTILGVSLDRNKESWLKAIEQDKLVWPYHISDLKAWQSAAAKAYGIAYIPQAFLIGPDGKVIGKYMFAEQAKEDLEKYLSK